jgi:hypothetical protein
MEEVSKMKWFRSIGIAAVALGVILLAIGWVIGNDILGFLFMVFLVVGVALLVADFVVRRRSHAPV